MAETYAGEFYCVKCKEKREAEGDVVISESGRQHGQGRLSGLRHQAEPDPRQGLSRTRTAPRGIVRPDGALRHVRGLWTTRPGGRRARWCRPKGSAMRLRAGLRVLRRTRHRGPGGHRPALGGPPAPTSRRRRGGPAPSVDLAPTCRVARLVAGRDVDPDGARARRRAGEARLTDGGPSARLRGPAAVDAQVWSLLRADGRRCRRRPGARGPGGRASSGWVRPGSGSRSVSRRRASARSCWSTTSGRVRSTTSATAGTGWADVGSVREHVAARLLRDVAPHVSTDVGPRRRTSWSSSRTGVADPGRGTGPRRRGPPHLVGRRARGRHRRRPVRRARAPARACAASTCTAPTRTRRGPRSLAQLRTLGGLRRRVRARRRRLSPGLGAAAVLAHLDGVAAASRRASTFEVGAAGRGAPQTHVGGAP